MEQPFVINDNPSLDTSLMQYELCLKESKGARSLLILPRPSAHPPLRAINCYIAPLSRTSAI